MAKSKDLNAAMKELKKNYRRVLKEAVQYATEEAKKDVYNKALSCLEEYYDSYEPNSYNRTYHLEDAFVPYDDIKATNTHITSIVGIVYDTSLLTTYVVGSKNYGSRDVDEGKEILPIEEWIMNNYLDGIHPYTDGSRVPGEAVYYEIIDSPSPTKKMDNFLEKYANTFSNNVHSYLAAYLLR